KEKIIVFGDYDVDGITGTAVLWETLYKQGADVTPYIPHRVDEGYGLSIKGIENVLTQFPDTRLIITVDNGIVANEAVAFANKKGIDVIITDHHTIGEKLPDAFTIVHTIKLCGAGVAWILSREITRDTDMGHLDLVALATVADLVPLTGANRTILKEGLQYLRNTQRVGLTELFMEAGIKPEDIDVYHIGHIIGPRLNAMGRMESAMDSLRLLCTKDRVKARMLAAKLGVTNRERQLVTQSASLHAIEHVRNNGKTKNLLFVANESYEEGVIGLVAGKLVEEYYRPSIVVSIGQKVSKASARSVAGFNIIEFIRLASEHLINAGGHPMAAGFTVETEKIVLLQEMLEKIAEEKLTPDSLTPVVKIDLEVPLSIVSASLYDALKSLGPFGMANPEPVFATKAVEVVDARAIGRDKSHLKMVVSENNLPNIEAIAFGMGELAYSLKPGSKIDIAYVVDENEWNGRKTLQLKIRDIIKEN
ncbi:MAG: single-stranded-DNA-specific exonuclease RecJ, partial [Patescibacteria group bacterium]|nr:single-stranded-DNA-specific exonuclease RecJ [Patescibacteria group bacterium]